MPYRYETQRPRLFEPDGQRLLAKIQAKTRWLIDRDGHAEVQEAWDGCTGDSWMMLACFDWMVEQGEIAEVSKPGTWAQNRLYVAAAKATSDLFSMLSIIEEYRDKSSA